MGLLLLPLFMLGAFGGHLLRANLDVRRDSSKLHTRIAALADTGRRPPSAFLSMVAGRAAEPDDFGAGIAVACGCERPDRTIPNPGRCCLAALPSRPPPSSCSEGACTR